MAKLEAESLASAYAAASAFVERGLRRDDSLFSPGVPIWTKRSVDDLYDRFVQRPDESDDDFMTKWKRQLSGAPAETIQFTAELLYVHLFAGSSTGRSRKEELIREVLSWTGQQIKIPTDLLDGLDTGFSAEGVAWRTMRWAMLSYLIRFLRHFKALSQTDREVALRDPWAFKTIAESVDLTRAYSQKEIMLHLVHPDTFEPIMSGEVKEKIADRMAESLGFKRNGDVDRDLLEARRRLESEFGPGFSFYRTEVRDKWDKGRVAAGGKPPMQEVAGTPNYWKVAPGRGGVLWPLWKEESCISIGYLALGDISKMTSEDFAEAKQEAKEVHPRWKDMGMNQVWRLAHDLKKGDRVVANKGFSQVLGIGTVTGDYYFVPGHDHPHRRKVTWDDVTPRDVDPRGWRPALMPLSKATFEEIVAPRRATLDALADELLIGRSYLQRVVRLLKDKRQLILFGPPGTGKTFVARKLAAQVADGEDRVTLVQFHPSYAYEDFIEGYRPTLLDNGMPGFKLRSGPLMRLAERAAAAPDETFILVIDEINRGNLAKVFGELFFLLEYRDHSINLQYSDEPFSLPQNLLIIGTMNTADRSIALLDAALRRRFYFVPFFPDQEPVAGLLLRWLQQNQPDYVWLADVVDLANKRLDQPEIAIGPSYFLREELDDTWIADIWSHAIKPYLTEHFIGDPSRLAEFGFDRLRAEVLGAPEQATDLEDADEEEEEA